VPDLKLNASRDDRAQAGAGGPRPLRDFSWDPAAVTAWARRIAAMATPRALWRQHKLITVLVLLSLLPRVLAALAFRPALLTADSFLYMQEATTGVLGVIRPSGYSLFLALLRPLPDTLLAVTAAQHLMGVAIAAIVYGLLRYRGLPAWGACLAAAPTLFDPREIALESFILPDTLYCLVILVAIALLLTFRTPRTWQCAVAGLLFAYVAVLRGNGLPLLLVVAAFLLIRRVGWRALTAGAVACVVPLFCYAALFDAQHGQFNFTDSDGIFLWSRTTSFANCAIIKPPRALLPLCPNRETSVRVPAHAPAWSISALVNAPTPADYLWASDVWWRHDAHPGINAYNNKLGLEFALDAIKAQPLGYLRVAASNVMLLFLANDRPQTQSTMSFTLQPHIAVLPSYYKHYLDAYAGTTTNTHPVEPYAYFLLLYQQPVWFTGVAFFLAVLAGLVGVLRRWRSWGGPAALPWALALVSIVLPALITQSLYRYTIVAIPLACLAAGMAFIRQGPQPAPAGGPAVPVADDPGTATAGPATVAVDPATPAARQAAGTTSGDESPAAPGAAPADPAEATAKSSASACRGAAPGQVPSGLRRALGLRGLIEGSDCPT
jgi:hypothetical protein